MKVGWTLLSLHLCACRKCAAQIISQVHPGSALFRDQNTTAIVCCAIVTSHHHLGAAM